MDKKYDFNKKEKKWQNFWIKEKIYKFKYVKNRPIYSIDTPPPTLSGRMHIGHAFSYTQEDIIARYKRMKGEIIFYPFGTDDNGLATEKLVEKENKIKIFNMKRHDFIKLCQKTIKKLKPEFIQDWKDIGMSCDFSLKYSTINFDIQKLSQKYFLELYKKKRAYRKEGPTIWCPLCQTAIAQAEMEDKEKEGIFYNIDFSVGKEKITIATTRPELLPSCVALFVHPDDKRYKRFIGKQAIVPIFNHEIKIIKDSKVDPKKGTGAVMCCTFGDTVDIEWFFSYNLPLIVSIDKCGKFNENAKKYQGLTVLEAKKQIVQELKNKNLIKKEEKIKHTVNVHERCGTFIEIIPTDQWFIKYLDLKKDFLDLGKKLKWIPNHFRNRYNNWVSGLKWDWCISRQRYFGIPFPVWYCKHCKKEITAKISDLPVDPFLSKPKAKCCQKSDYIPDKNVLDTWATSSLSPQIAQSLVKNKEVKRKIFPMSIRPQAHDIINFWLFYTVARSKIHFNKLPWSKTAISGFVLDEKGEKMSKSKGNVVDPQLIITKYSADALRYWASSVAFGEDLRWSEKEITGAKRTLTKLWNASKFSISHLKDYNPKKISKNLKLEAEDKWIISKFQKTISNYEDCFEKYQYEKARKVIDYFFWDCFCSNYIEMTKSRLYNLKRSPKGAKFATYYVLLGIIKLYAPFIPFLTEEIYQNYFKRFEKEKSIHLTLFFKNQKKYHFSKEEKDVDAIIEIISAVRKYKSEKGISLGKEIDILSIQTKNKNIKKYFEIIKDTLSVKEINFEKGNLKVNKEVFVKIK